MPRPSSDPLHERVPPHALLVRSTAYLLFKCTICHLPTREGLETALCFSGGFRIVHLRREN